MKTAEEKGEKIEHNNMKILRVSPETHNILSALKTCLRKKTFDKTIFELAKQRKQEQTII